MPHAQPNGVISIDMSVAIKAVTVVDADGFILLDHKPLCLPHAHVYRRDANPAWTVTFEAVGSVTECARCLYEYGPEYWRDMDRAT